MLRWSHDRHRNIRWPTFPALSPPQARWLVARTTSCSLGLEARSSQHRRVNRKFLAVKEAPEPVEECSWVFFEGMGRARVHNAAHPRYGLLLGLSPVSQDGACDRCNIIASTCQIDDCLMVTPFGESFGPESQTPFGP